MNPGSFDIEVIRSGAEEHADELIAFWSAHGALDEGEARRRLPEVVCVLRDATGAIVGVNSVYANVIGIIGREFWIYRTFIAPGPGVAAAPAMVQAAFDALEAEHDPEGGGPVGLALLIDDPATISERPEAVWPEAGLMYAGYTDDLQQIRIAYFEQARIA